MTSHDNDRAVRNVAMVPFHTALNGELIYLNAYMTVCISEAVDGTALIELLGDISVWVMEDIYVAQLRINRARQSIYDRARRVHRN